MRSASSARFGDASRRTPGAGALAFAVLTMAGAGRAVAQPPVPAPEPPPYVEASGQFSFIDTRGNTTTQSLGTAGEVIWRPDPWIYRAKTTFAQSEADGVLDARSLAALFRASRTFGPKWAAYGQYDYLRDVFSGIEQRHVVEGGVSYLAVDAAPHRLRFDSGLGYLFEKRPPRDEDFDSATLSLGAAYRFGFGEANAFTYEPRYLLPLADTGASKFDQEAALSVALNKVLSLKVSHTIRHSADPPDGFDATDAIMAVAIAATVKRPR